MNPDAHDFVVGNTEIGSAELVPELRVRTARAMIPIWRATELWFGQQNCTPPYWAFVWPGGQALARFLLDHPDRAAGRHVLDFACGCGIAAVAAARAGAASVTASDIDVLAIAAARSNARLNKVEIEVTGRDMVGEMAGWDLILCGDVCYEAPMARHILPWLRRLAAQSEVWVADPGRAYLPQSGLERFARYAVPTTRDLEDRDTREVTLYRMLGTI